MGVLVDAFDNPQMKCYALGALKIFDRLYDIKDVSMQFFSHAEIMSALGLFLLMSSKAGQKMY